jgi:catechol 2,3-dioxygenase-like lactoylglutathione lyase family enzyme
VSLVHHSAISVRDVEASLRFWRDGLGFSILMDHQFEGDWPTLLLANSTTLRSVFLGDPARPDAGIVELVDLGQSEAGGTSPSAPTPGFLLISIMTNLEAALERLSSLGLGGPVRRIEVAGVAMAVVSDPDGVQVELIDNPALQNLSHLGESAG